MRIARSLTLSVFAIFAACEDLQEIGSQCTHGDCQSLSLPIVSDCLVTSIDRQLVRDLEHSALCLDPALERDANGLMPCDIFWTADDPQQVPGELEHCSEFLRPASKAWNGAARCRVNQLPLNDAGQPPMSGAGIYFAEHLEGAPAPCDSGFRYTAGIAVPSGVHVDLSCAYAQVRNRDGELENIDPQRCLSASRLAASDKLGDACLPDPAPESYEIAALHLDTAAPSCGAGACLTFHVDQLLLDHCTDPQLESCLDQQLLRDHTYCSCRCDAPAGEQAPECECPSGYACVPSIDHGPFAGSYCVLSSTVIADP